MRPQGCEFLIIGAGILGLTIARELVRRGAKDVVILEKEQTVGQHASGRNSGVLHAGIYYTPETHKARFCVEGNRRMKDFCRQRNLDLHETGKVIVATHEDELPRLDELHRRAQASGAQADLISPDELREIEPYARTVKRALYTPDTALVDPQQVLTALRSGLEASGRVAFQMGTRSRTRAMPGVRMAESASNSASTSPGPTLIVLPINSAWDRIT
ncbi:MAG: NAD(P)/FAD-dependent oxidoreductase [Salinibacter sp.]